MRAAATLLLASLAIASSIASVPDQELPTITPSPGLVIDRSGRVAPGRYRLPAPSDDAPALTIRGDGITVDLTGVTFEGADPLADPDSHRGTGLLIEDSRGVTINGMRGAIRGYKVAVHARRAPALRIDGLDASYNWKPRLWSGIEKESLLDWLSYHDNEKNEWLRYGAGIYLDESDEARISNIRVVQGQNGLLVSRSSGLEIWNNTFAWNSGLGIGLYRVTNSRIMHNRLDWNVRGYSHSFYYRGQDSAALLMYEQTSNNVVAFNSATHGGDGVFLWAGQSTMDTGRGGANDNLFYSNDFSHAVANGIEATFSRNRFIGNRIEDCWHGVWAGYSYETAFLDNSFARNDEAIAIEHGQNILVLRNRFDGDQTAIRLWANPTQDPNWGYPKTRDTRSRDYSIQFNTFSGHKTALHVTRTTGLDVRGNTYTNVAVPLTTGADVTGLEFEPPSAVMGGDPVRAATPLADGMNPMLPADALRGRATIIVDEWGPYDYRSPKIWPAGKTGDRPLRLRVLGPAGTWTLKTLTGGASASRAGAVPGELVVTPSGRGLDLRVELEYRGGEAVTPRGVVYPAGAAVPVTFDLLEPEADWSLSWWTYDDKSDPRTAPDRFAARMRERPTLAARASRIEFVSGRALVPGLPNDRVALRAESTVRIPAGGAEMIVMSDDGVRVWVDGRLVIDRWTVHGTEIDRVRLAAGARRVRIEYFEATGWAELQVRYRR